MWGVLVAAASCRRHVVLAARGTPRLQWLQELQGRLRAAEAVAMQALVTLRLALLLSTMVLPWARVLTERCQQSPAQLHP